MNTRKVLQTIESAISHPFEHQRLGPGRANRRQGLQLKDPGTIDVDKTRLHLDNRLWLQHSPSERTHGQNLHQHCPRQQQVWCADYQRRICVSMRASTPRAPGMARVSRIFASSAPVSTRSALDVSHSGIPSSIGA